MPEIEPSTRINPLISSSEEAPPEDNISKLAHPKIKEANKDESFFSLIGREISLLSKRIDVFFNRWFSQLFTNIHNKILPKNVEEVELEELPLDEMISSSDIDKIATKEGKPFPGEKVLIKGIYGYRVIEVDKVVNNDIIIKDIYEEETRISKKELWHFKPLKEIKDPELKAIVESLSKSTLRSDACTLVRNPYDIGEEISRNDIDEFALPPDQAKGSLKVGDKVAIKTGMGGFIYKIGVIDSISKNGYRIKLSEDYTQILKAEDIWKLKPLIEAELDSPRKYETGDAISKEDIALFKSNKTSPPHRGDYVAFNDGQTTADYRVFYVEDVLENGKCQIKGSYFAASYEVEPSDLFKLKKNPPQ